MTGPSECAIDNCTVEATEAIICPDHETRLRRLLDGGLARLYVELNIALRPGRGGSDEPNVTTSKPIVLPISTAARTAQQDILTTVLTAEATLRGHRDWMPTPPRGREGPTLVGSCAVLANHLDELLRLPGGHLFAVTLFADAQRARFAAGKNTGSKTNRVAVPCPACDMRALRRVNGTDDIACGYCDVEITAQQLDDLLDPPIQREAA